MLRKSISATQFEKAFDANELTNHGILEIIGDVKFGNRRIERPLSLAGIVFHGEVDFAGVQIQGDLDFSRCTFIKRLDLRGAVISGDVILEEAEIFGRGGLGNELYIALDARVATIGGTFRGRFLVVDGIVSGNGTTFNGGLDLSGSEIVQRESQIAQLDLANAEVSGDLKIDSIHNVKVRADLVQGRGITVKGDVSFSGIATNSIDLSGSQISGKVSFRGVTANYIDLSGSRLAGMCSVGPGSTNQDRSVIRGDFDAHYARFESGLWISGSTSKVICVWTVRLSMVTWTLIHQESSGRKYADNLI